VTTAGHECVYIVDDDPSVRKGFARVVRSAGFDARVFESADAFFGSGSARASGCLVVDAKMPVSGGPDMLTRLRHESPGMPVIVVTAHDDPETRKVADEVGAVSYFRKPVDADALLDAISWALSRKKEWGARQ
jgi:FixJ family two-component response regulator